jgi:hypothetical protein
VYSPPPVVPGERVTPPDGLLLYVDGESALYAPTDGVHLAQLTDGRWWKSVLLVARPVPPEWIGTGIEPPPHVAAWVDTWLALVGVASHQEVPPAASDFLVSRSGRTVVGAWSAELTATTPSRVGASVAGGAALLADRGPTWLDARAALAIRTASWWVDGGVAVVRIAVTDEGDGEQRVALAHPSVGGGLRIERPWALEVAGAAGAAWAVRHGEVRIALLGPGRAVRPRFGTTASGTWAGLEQPESGLRLDVAAWTVAADVGVSWSTER